MPCHDPRDNISIRDVERCRDEGEAHYAKLHSEYSKLIDLMCSVCGDIEAADGPQYFDENPELKIWWEDHKKEDEARLIKEREDINAARLAVKAAADYIETYTGMLVNRGLSASDQAYFTDKILGLKKEISEVFKRFPDIAKEYM